MSDDDKKRVNIEDLPVPLEELDKEEQENVTGGGGLVPGGIVSPYPVNPRPGESGPNSNPTSPPSPLNPLKNP